MSILELVKWGAEVRFGNSALFFQEDKFIVMHNPGRYKRLVEVYNGDDESEAVRVFIENHNK